MIGIYAIRNKTNNKYYIGQSKDIRKRVCAHFSVLKNNKHYNVKLQNSFNIHNKENFEKLILEEINVYDKQKLTELEDQWIIFHDSIKNGYNCLKAKDIYDRTSEQNISLSERHKLNGHMPPRSAIEKSANKRRGKTFDEIYGLDDSKEIRNKISNNNEWYGEQRGKSIEKIYGEEKATNIRKTLSETNSKYWEGKNRSRELKEKLSTMNCKTGKIFQFDLNGILVKEWINRIELFENFNKSAIKSCLSGKLETHKKFIWRYEFPPVGNKFYK